MQTQKTIDFNRAVRLRWIDRMVWPMGDGRWPRSPVKALLRAIESYDRGRGEAWPSVGELARNLGVSVRTVQRALKLLAEAGLVRIETRLRANGSETSRLYRIDWSKVLSCVPPSESEGGDVPQLRSVSKADSGSIAASGSIAESGKRKAGVADAVRRAVTNCHPPGDKLSPPPRQTVTPPVTNCHPQKPYTINNHRKHTQRNHMGDGQEEMETGRLYWGRQEPLTAADLTDWGVVRELWSYARLQNFRRAAGGAWRWAAGEAARLRFFALCLYCARSAENPGRMLTANCRAGRWYGSAQDEAAAREAIRREESGQRESVQNLFSI